MSQNNKTILTREKLKERIFHLIEKGFAIIYMDTSSILYIDDKLNLIEEDITKL